jgi:5-formyltetrahydrofolate cyclo-ligase
MELSKKEIRNKIINNRDMLDLRTRSDMDEVIFNKFINSDYYKKAEVIFAFVSFASEVDTKKIIEYAIKENKTICVPKVKSREEGFEIYKIKGLQDLEAGFYGILEPKVACEIIDYESIDFILMPGVAFDKYGGRIGYGGGFYDRYLSKLKKDIPKIAISYELQIIDKIPMALHDIPIDGIITEKEILTF